MHFFRGNPKIGGQVFIKPDRSLEDPPRRPWLLLLLPISHKMRNLRFLLLFLAGIEGGRGRPWALVHHQSFLFFLLLFSRYLQEEEKLKCPTPPRLVSLVGAKVRKKGKFQTRLVEKEASGEGGRNLNNNNHVKKSLNLPLNSRYKYKNASRMKIL